ncbi:transposase, partial [Staphylococcus aureus]|uniref:transposase n=1 Tax=Staphylococcus aureus TaxID=1280 RepID=UPI00203BC6C6
TLVTKGDLNELFRSHLEKAINTLLRTELTAFLDYEKYDRTGFNSGNSRNGSYFRSIKTEYGELTLEIPRDRNGEFKQQTLPAYKKKIFFLMIRRPPRSTQGYTLFPYTPL